jgi:peroxiredoxin
MNRILQLLGKYAWLRRTIEVVMFAAVFFGVRAYMQGDVAKGQMTPFSGTTILGEPFTYSSYQGKPVLLHFWATWCPICEQEQSSIQSISQDYQVISIAMQSGSAAEVVPYMQERQLTFPVIADEDGSLSKQFGVSVVPASFVIDADHQVRFVEIGFTTEIGLRARLWLAGLQSGE